MEKATRSFRNGDHATVYELMRDPKLQNKDVIRDKKVPLFPFVGGSKYKGQWNNDKKEGFGSELYPDGSKYEGEWFDNKRHGSGTLWIKKKKSFVRQYVGSWVNGHIEGLGSYHYESGEVFKGIFSRGKRHGQGRHDFTNGDYYIGEWQNDKQQGSGTLYSSNGNIFDGAWVDGKKEGPGKFYYASTSKVSRSTLSLIMDKYNLIDTQVYEGEWVDDQPKCGEYRAPKPSELSLFGKPHVRQGHFDLPEIGLENPRAVLDLAISEARMERSPLGGNGFTFSSETLQSAEKIFDSIDTTHVSLLPLRSLGEVFAELGLAVTPDDLAEIAAQLEIEQSSTFTFPEVVEIALFLINGSSSS